MRLHRWLSTAASIWLAACGGDSAAPAPTASLSAAATTVSPGATTVLSWTSTNASACAANGGWSGSLAAAGTQVTAALSTSTTYALTCSGAGGTSTAATVTVNVAPTATLEAAPSSVAFGADAVLTWSAANATACTASGGWSGARGTSGTQTTAALTTATTFALTCNGPGGSSAAAVVTVNVLPTATLTASVAAVPVGGTAQLTWTSANATSCTASGGWAGGKPAMGTQSTGALAATTVYTLTCNGPGGSSAPASATVVSGPMALSPALTALTAAQTAQYTATLPGGGAVAWSVDGSAGGSASAGRITASGLYTPGTAAGRHTIGASSVAYPALAVTAVAAVTGLAGVYTYHNDLARDGVNAQEYALTPGNVRTQTFGKLFSCPVDGAVYAQPLWVANLSLSGARHNVVFVATEHDSVFAFDADAAPCTPLWSVSLLDAAHGVAAAETSVPSGVPGTRIGRGVGDITPEVGITGTPVIDPASGTLYVVAKSVGVASGIIVQRLHALAIATGAEQAGAPVITAATVPGTGDGGTFDAFNPVQENQRAGLALVGGVVYAAWAAHEDAPPWYGWMMGYSYNGSALTQTAVLNTAPDTQDAGIWMGGGAPAADAANHLYVVTGNGNFDAASGVAPNDDYGQSLLELSGALAVGQYFSPTDGNGDNGTDLDFGAGGAAVLTDLPAGSPLAHLILCGGKDQFIYVLNRDVLGGVGDAAAVQKIDLGHRILATGAYFNATYYIGGMGGPLAAFVLDASVPSFTAAGTSAHTFLFGGTPSVSAAGTSSGIVWTLDNTYYCTTFSTGCGAAVLYAYDASNLAAELWDSAMVPADAAGNAVKFTVPTVANGKVYVGTRGNNTGAVAASTSTAGELDVYGLKAP